MLCIPHSGNISFKLYQFNAYIIFRENYTPQLDIIAWPAFVALTSVNNVVIEQVWNWLRKTTGINIENCLVEGLRRGIFNPANVIHM
jgi:hypothetical protein